MILAVGLTATKFYVEAARVRRYAEKQRLLKIILDRKEAEAQHIAAAKAAAAEALATKERERAATQKKQGAAPGTSSWPNDDPRAQQQLDADTDVLGNIADSNNFMSHHMWGAGFDSPSDEEPEEKNQAKPTDTPSYLENDCFQDQAPFVDSDDEYVTDIKTFEGGPNMARSRVFFRAILTDAERFGLPTDNGLEPLTFVLPRSVDLPNSGQEETTLWEESRSQFSRGRKLTRHAFLRHPEVPKELKDPVKVPTMSFQEAADLRQSLKEAEAPFFASFTQFKNYLSIEHIACASTQKDFCLLCHLSFTSLSPSLSTCPVMAPLMASAASAFSSAMELLTSTQNNIAQHVKSEMVATMINFEVVSQMDPSEDSLFKRMLHFNNGDKSKLFCTIDSVYIHGTRHMTKDVCIETILQSMVNGLADIWTSIRKTLTSDGLKTKDYLALISTIISLMTRFRHSGGPPGPVAGSGIMNKTGANTSRGANGNGVTAGIRKGAQGRRK